MRLKTRWKIDALMRDVKSHESSPTLIVRLHVAMADQRTHKGDRWILGSVWSYKGYAVVVPSTLRCGVLVCDWGKFLRYAARHDLV